MASQKPTKAQAAALALLANGDAYRSTRAFADRAVHSPRGRISDATAALVRNGWAVWGGQRLA